MQVTSFTTVLVSVLLFFVALLFSAVGHGGASGYLAVMSVFAFNPQEMASTALLLNIVVASISFVTFLRAGHFRWQYAGPFLITSVPAAFIGGMVHVSSSLYAVLLACTLFIASLRLIFSGSSQQENSITRDFPPMSVSLLTGLCIGFISGIVGMGGGIFLSPILLLTRWATAKQTAAVASLFIIVNSIAGIIGRVIDGSFTAGASGSFLIAAVAGGFLGSWWGSHRTSNIALQRMLGCALIVASVKLIFQAF